MPMVGQKYEIARMRAELHRDNYRQLLRFLIILNAIGLALIICIVYVIFFQPAPTYFATTSTGLIIPLRSQG
jgi:archaellum biogenesis protein FlaJ (TadC family)